MIVAVPWYDSQTFWTATGPAVALVVGVGTIVVTYAVGVRAQRATEAGARSRLALAEEQFPLTRESVVQLPTNAEEPASQATEQFKVGREQAEERREDEPITKQLVGQQEPGTLNLAALSMLTNARLDLYYTIELSQARQSFLSAQSAIIAGFVFLIGFAGFAARVQSAIIAVTIGILGAASGALAIFASSFFLRSYVAAANAIRAYSDQPLELSRYLAAERLLSEQDSLDAERRAEILAELVNVMLGVQSRKPGST